MAPNSDDRRIARALIEVLGDSTWAAVGLAKGYLALAEGASIEGAVEKAYAKGSFSKRELRKKLESSRGAGLKSLFEPRTRTGSAENPITKLFPAQITEERFLVLLDELVALGKAAGRELRLEDDRASHSLLDFAIVEGERRLPINIKNAGTLFRNSASLVGLAPDDCIPIPAYKAFGALEKGEKDLVYAVCVDLDLVKTVNELIPAILSESEKLTWAALESYSGQHVKRAEDAFVHSIVTRYWKSIEPKVAQKPFRLISARRAIKIFQTMPKRTPGLGLRAWGTGASAEVNVHISISGETTPWETVRDRIVAEGVGKVLELLSRTILVTVDDPQI